MIKASIVYVKEVFAAGMLQLSLHGCIHDVFCNTRRVSSRDGTIDSSLELSEYKIDYISTGLSSVVTNSLSKISFSNSLHFKGAL